jgi:hypothetical protein
VVLTVVLTVVLIVVLPGVDNASCGRYLTQLAGLAVSDRYERGWGSYPTHVWCWLSSVGYIMAYLLAYLLFGLSSWSLFGFAQTTFTFSKSSASICAMIA